MSSFSSCSNTSASKTRPCSSRRSATTTNRVSRAYPAKLDGEADEPPPVDLDEVQVWDLLDAFNRLMKEVGTRKPRFHEVTYDDTPIDLHAADIEDRLKREKQADAPRPDRRPKEPQRNDRRVPGAAGTHPREKNPRQPGDDAGDDIEIEEASEEHKKTYAQASLHLAAEAASVECGTSGRVAGRSHR